MVLKIIEFFTERKFMKNVVIAIVFLVASFFGFSKQVFADNPAQDQMAGQMIKYLGQQTGDQTTQEVGSQMEEEPEKKQHMQSCISDCMSDYTKRIRAGESVGPNCANDSDCSSCVSQCGQQQSN